MSYSNFEQKVVVNNYLLSGIQSIDGSYGISETPVRIAGVGFVDAMISQPLQGNFNISRKMVSHDPLLELNSVGKYKYDEEEIEGIILYDNKGFGFNKGRVTRYSVNCNVGEMPDIETDIIVYGDLGKGVPENPFEGLREHPPIKFPDQSSIKVSVSDFEIDAITSFSFSRSLQLTPVYALPKGDFDDWDNGVAGIKNLEPVQIDTQYPIETDINFTMIANDYEIRQIKDRIQAAPKSDVTIEIKDSFDNNYMINSYTGFNVRLIGETVNSTLDGEMSISLTYKGYETYHNPVPGAHV